ncbi:MAG: hypothetical protein JXB88_10025 [Spirochaetales bacterium]|nr:hypothetical protein [Spirochaetales bacterium]
MRLIIIIILILMVNIIYSQDIEFLSKYFMDSNKIECKMFNIFDDISNPDINGKDVTINIKMISENAIGFYIDDYEKPIFVYDKKNNSINLSVKCEGIQYSEITLVHINSIVSIDDLFLIDLDYGDSYYYSNENDDYLHEAGIKIAKKGNRFYLFCFEWVHNKDIDGRIVEAWGYGNIFIYNQE